MIKIKNVTKSFNNVKVINDLSLTINKGQIFGVIGKSGAGKSTLIRLLNGLETVDKGSIYINEMDITNCSYQSLNLIRKQIGFVFQDSNLLSSLTVSENIALALSESKFSKDEIKMKVIKVLKIVGLESKINDYPKNLSGGQKQRVGIARSLVLEPQVLLCDEATSALDPQTTKEILELLQKVNEEYNLTIVVITHEMDVVKDLCDQVAILDHGTIVETGNVFDVLVKPQAEITKTFIEPLVKTTEISEYLSLLPIEKKELIIKLQYYAEDITGSLIYNIANQVNPEFVIIGGTIVRTKNKAYSYLYVSFKTKQLAVIDYLTMNKINYEVELWNK